ncbi:glycosyltransferase [Candidatus Woesearchaeota archaeon]|nr:glycosyltransferase [Candidatus Woesearchaeota archaeon]
MDISIIIPAYDEEDNVLPLYDKIKEVMENMPSYFKKLDQKDLSKRYKSYEIIFIDDGSSDMTFENLKKIKDRNVRLIRFRKNFGQSAAWLAGFHHAQGDVVFTMDSDLQNDPKDIPRLLAKLEEGYDCISGWRRKRKDSLSKHIFSRISNLLRHKLINDNVHDSGCSLKAYRKECLKDIELYGEMHRYITSLIKLRGFRIGEIKVRHMPRIHNKTKYNLYRIIKGFLDLWNVWFWQKFSGRPLHLFGALGILIISFGLIGGFFSVYMKIFRKVDLSDTFLPVIAIFSVMVGIQLLVSGILGDIIIKNYHRISGKKGYELREVIQRR